MGGLFGEDSGAGNKTINYSEPACCLNLKQPISFHLRPIALRY